jgi:hypothetical protein
LPPLGSKDQARNFRVVVDAERIVARGSPAWDWFEKFLSQSFNLRETVTIAAKLLSIPKNDEFERLVPPPSPKP